MINIFKKIYIHPLYFFFLFIIIITANIRSFIEFSLIILIHELGHIITSLILKWNIKKIVVLPYGMITIFKNCLSKSIYQELLILIMGPIFQIIFNCYFRSQYSNYILFINLLPIYPLDGSKILFLLFNKLTSYYNSYILIYLLSFITIVFIVFNNFNLLIILMIIYLFYHLLNNIFNLNNILISFLYERFKKHYRNKSVKIINNLNFKKISRCKYHFFKIKNKLVSEEEILRKTFDK